MDDMMSPFSTDQWIQQYPNTPSMIIQPSDGHDQPSDTTTIPIYRDSSQRTATSQVSPKPIRRRSRASRRTPTTVLNASPTDFRALVQRFTGCDSKDNLASASLVNLPKGPVNIDFSRTNDVNEGSSRYAYFDDNQVRVPSQGEQMLPVGDLQASYGMENASVVYDQSIDESSLMETRRDGGSYGYNV